MKRTPVTKWHPRTIGMALTALLVLGLTLAACTSASPTPTLEPTATVPPTSTPEATATPEGQGHTEISDDPVIQAGYNVFVATGCSACHGQNAEGTTFAPALNGHSDGQVHRQVRAPVGTMPVFPPDKLSASELDNLVAYITSLDAGHMHEMEIDLGPAIQMHHWMALFAVEDGEFQEAIHHVEHLLNVLEGDHLARMKNVLTELQAGNPQDAGHEIEEMLAGVLDDGVSGITMHVTLALSSVRVDDAEAAIHHLEHFAEIGDGANLEMGNEILALLQAGNLTEAEHELTELLEAMGVAVETDMDTAHSPLQEALEAMEQGNLDTAATELGEFIESATGMDRIKAQEALTLIQAGSLHDAEDIIGEMLGIAHN
ncbi:MAG: c-type cytochrome [Chloroflexi bacterium]|nr:c-type cytochrome [Chloroflexota bacterium]